MKIYSSTGAIASTHGYKICIEYNDLTCPYCGNGRLYLWDENLNYQKIGVRYRCQRCGLTVPIGHNTDNFKFIKPGFRDAENFIKDYGTDIHDRINSIIKGGIEI